MREAGFPLLALTPDEKAVPIDTARPPVLRGPRGPAAGRRGQRTVPPRALRAADEWVRIPMAHGVDSLNVGAAAAVGFYALARQAG